MAMSSMLFPAACLAPNRGPAIYTASAPQSIAAMPMSAFLAGARSSRLLIPAGKLFLESLELLLGLCPVLRV